MGHPFTGKHCPLKGTFIRQYPYALITTQESGPQTATDLGRCVYVFTSVISETASHTHTHTQPHNHTQPHSHTPCLLWSRRGLGPRGLRWAPSLPCFPVEKNGPEQHGELYGQRNAGDSGGYRSYRGDDVCVRRVVFVLFTHCLADDSLRAYRSPLSSVSLQERKKAQEVHNTHTHTYSHTQLQVLT